MFPAVLCIPLFIALALLQIAPNLGNARFILRSSEDEGSRRAAYFLILYPLVLLSFFLATWSTSFMPSMTFGFPLFVVGAFAYPHAALIIRKQNKATIQGNLLKVKCWKCTYVFEMHRMEEWVRCPYCGEPNLNPTTEEEEGSDGEVVEAEVVEETDSSPSST
jgi:ribosomal protein S27E